MEWGCECEILECDRLPGGRFNIQVLGKRAFRVVNCTEQDGYRVARVTYAPKEPTSDHERQLAQVVSNEVDHLIKSFHSLDITTLGDGLRCVTELLRNADTKPGPNDPEALALWLLQFLPNLDEQTSYALLQTFGRTKERLEFSYKVLKSMKGTASQGQGNCTIM
jgi:Lon protease-like protein